MKLNSRYCLLTLFFIFFAVVSYAQESSRWQRYTARGEEFSALLPEEPSVSEITRPIRPFEKTKRGRMYAAYGDGTVYVILSLDNPNRKEALEVFIKEFEQYPVFRAGFEFERDVTLKGFKGKQYSLSPANASSVSGIVQFYLTDNHAYIFEVVGEDLTKPPVNEFLTSLTLNGKTKGVDVLGASQNGGSESAATPSSSTSAATTQQSSEDRIYNPKDVTRKAVLVTRPEPRYTEEARKAEVSGTVVIRAIFSSTGKVTNIRTVSGLPHGLTERAVMAAESMKFLPAVKDGKYVSQYIQIEYNFNLY
ncbi:MAG TPA: energy transducer TonB [Pyrinomonadaceae bacterium]|nr:energy transducer TonB [Pyrinomonadaceae bacterium]